MCVLSLCACLEKEGVDVNDGNDFYGKNSF
jgi:hypothetical protein